MFSLILTLFVIPVIYIAMTGKIKESVKVIE
jgi:hypothetical protein